MFRQFANNQICIGRQGDTLCLSGLND